MMLVRKRVNLSGLELGMQDPLRGINSVVPGEEIGDGDGHQVEGGAAEAEHLAADEERCDGAVRHAAEDAGHADGREECRISADEQGKGVTEGGADEEEGTISPPWKPPDRVTAVKRIFSRKAAELI